MKKNTLLKVICLTLINFTVCTISLPQSFNDDRLVPVSLSVTSSGLNYENSGIVYQPMHSSSDSLKLSGRTKEDKPSTDVETSTRPDIVSINEPEDRSANITLKIRHLPNSKTNSRQSKIERIKNVAEEILQLEMSGRRP